MYSSVCLKTIYIHRYIDMYSSECLKTLYKYIDIRIITQLNLNIYCI